MTLEFETKIEIPYDKVNKIKISEADTFYLDKFIQIQGRLTSIPKKIMKTNSLRYCIECGEEVSKNNICKNCKTYNPIYKEDLKSVCSFNVEEILEDTTRQPTSIIVEYDNPPQEVFENILLNPGKEINVIGKLNYREKKDGVFFYYIKALEVESPEEDSKKVEIDNDSLEKIFKISKNDPLRILADSLSPITVGMEDIKKGIVLQMIGGGNFDLEEGIKSRDRIHILICGDPSTAKSNLAKNVLLRMPGSYYVSGESTSKVGISASVEKDELTGSRSLRPGALCLANDSVLVIDEIDKIPKDDKKILHTPLESGILPINKADIHTTLKANSSVLAICNPKHGLFDLYSPLVSQVELPPALFSRFDLIYLVRDKIDKENDSGIIKNIMDAVSGNKPKSIIDISLFRKYIAFSKNIKPKISKDEIEEYISQFYHTIRQKSKSDDGRNGLPIAPRQIFSIIRLSTALAKIHLRDKVIKDDVLTACQLLKSSLESTGIDFNNVADFSLIEGGITKKQIDKEMKLINEVKGILSNNPSENDLFKIVEERMLDLKEFKKRYPIWRKEGTIIGNHQSLRWVD